MLPAKSGLSSETERDWDRDLAEDVKGECEDKYGRVEFIKVERDSEVCSSLDAFPRHCLTVIFRERSTSSLTPSIPLRTQCRVSTVVGLEETKSRLPSSPTQSCKRISERTVHLLLICTSVFLLRRCLRQGFHYLHANTLWSQVAEREPLSCMLQILFSFLS